MIIPCYLRTQGSRPAVIYSVQTPSGYPAYIPEIYPIYPANIYDISHISGYPASIPEIYPIYPDIRPTFLKYIQYIRISGQHSWNLSNISGYPAYIPEKYPIYPDIRTTFMTYIHYIRISGLHSWIYPIYLDVKTFMGPLKPQRYIIMYVFIFFIK